MIVDRGLDWSESPWIQDKLDELGDDLFVYRDDASRKTTKVRAFLCVLSQAGIEVSFLIGNRP